MARKTSRPVADRTPAHTLARKLASFVTALASDLDHESAARRGHARATLTAMACVTVTSPNVPERRKVMVRALVESWAIVDLQKMVGTLPRQEAATSYARTLLRARGLAEEPADDVLRAAVVEWAGRSKSKGKALRALARAIGCGVAEDDATAVRSFNVAVRQLRQRLRESTKA